MHWPRGRSVGELSDGFHDPVPDRRSVIVNSECQLGSSSSALLQRLITVALEHQLRGSRNVDLGYHVGNCTTVVDKGFKDRLQPRLKVLAAASAALARRLTTLVTDARRRAENTKSAAIAAPAITSANG
jgi:hypothetical protein